ncbi:MAG: hypothetical protein LBD07_03205 [Spirochaetaceae bacterium]|jgi:hypothetical protein|nr:hypothetical protein [Spirochaetaceae bacterium]
MTAMFTARRAARRVVTAALAAVCLFAGCEQVTSSEPPQSSKEAEETGPLVREFYFATTDNNSSNTVFDMDNSTWADASEPPIKNEYWTLKVVEQPKTYFLVRRKGGYADPVQTITVGGPAASLVTQKGPGSALDGMGLYGEGGGYCYSGFEVRTDDFDMMFDGGKKYFTLKISEEGHASVTVHVTIVSAPDLTGTAVFRVSRTLGTTNINADMSAAQAENWTRSGRLTRIPPDTIQTMTLRNAQALQHWEDNTGISALDAIAWVNENGGYAEEYLIRIEKNEALPQFYLKNDVNATVRLRGARVSEGKDAERILSFNGNYTGGGDYNTYMSPGTSSGSKPHGFFILQTDSPATPFRLVLEKNVTLKGYNHTLANDGNGVRSMVELGAKGCIFIMTDGSKITGHTTPGDNGAVYLYASANYDPLTSRFWMFGGAITGNTKTTAPEYGTQERNASVVAMTYTGMPPGVFVKKGGVISGNRDNFGELNKVNDSVMIHYKRYLIQDGVEYFLPPEN